MSNRLFIAVLFTVVLSFLLYTYKPFLMNISIAVLLIIATHKINDFLIQKIKNRILGAMVSTIILSLLFFAPIFYALSNLALFVVNFDQTQIKDMVAYVINTKEMLSENLDFIKPQLDQLLGGIDAGKIAANTIGIATSFLKTSAVFFKDMILILVFYFFLGIYGDAMISYIKSLLPLSHTETKLLSYEVSSVMSVVFYSILVTAIFEGSLFSILGLAYGYDALLVGILYGFASLIPVIGGAIMWIPLSLYEAAHGEYTNAIVIALYSVIVISIIADTFIKPLIIKYINESLMDEKASVNELLIFFSILAGLSTFGFWGMILGPAITTLFLAILKLISRFKDTGTI
jgi:predicted PurR-regulated permease PerM